MCISIIQIRSLIIAHAFTRREPRGLLFPCISAHFNTEACCPSPPLFAYPLDPASQSPGMATLKVPATVPPVADDCEQLRKAFQGQCLRSCLGVMAFSISLLRAVRSRA